MNILRFTLCTIFLLAGSFHTPTYAEEDAARPSARSDEDGRSRSGKGKGRMSRGEDQAPQVGTEAPDLGVRPMLDGEDFNLSDPNRISVLIFGSHT
ncbi:MAG: hypothetical protein AAGA96_00100 [Verrucomicrobiota bacterium]